LAAALVGLSLGLACAANAQENKIDPKAKAILEEVTKTYKNLKAFHVKLSLKMKSNSTEPMAGQQFENVEIRLQKPNKIWASFTERAGDKATRRQIVSNGANLWEWKSSTNTYTKTKAPGRFAQIAGLPNAAPEFEILYYERDPFAVFPGPEAPLKLAAPAKVGEIDVDVLEAILGQEGVPFTATIRMMFGQKDRLMRGMTFAGSGKNPMNNQEITVNLDLTYELINASPTFTPADFTFTPPPGAKLEGSGSAPAKPKPGTKAKPGKQGQP
jgi:outer membrane lipoprotein-sorting protein